MEKKLGELYNDAAFCIQETYDNGYIITGNTQDYAGVSTGTRDLLLMKTDINGNEQWVKTFGGTSNDFGFSVQQTIDGGFIITGYTESYGQGERDILLIKTDINGNEQWMKTFGGEDDEEGYSIQQTTDGGYIITGYTESFGIGGEPYVYLIKTDENGNEHWTQTFGGDGYEIGFCIKQTTDGGYIIVGVTDSFGNGEEDIYLIKTNQFGNITSTFEIPLPNPNRKIEKTINLKGQEIKPQKNQSYIEIYDDGSVEKMIVIE